jgi:hypothetical protein
MHHPERVAPIINEYFSRLWKRRRKKRFTAILLFTPKNFHVNVDKK